MTNLPFMVFVTNAILHYFLKHYDYISGTRIPDIVLIQMHYRQICYRLVNLQEMKLINAEIFAFTKENHPKSEAHKISTIEIIPNTEKVVCEHMQIKLACEQL